jgi:hypothetical protein
MGMQDAAVPTDSTDWDSLQLIDSAWSTCQCPDGGIQFLREKTLERMWSCGSQFLPGRLVVVSLPVNWVVNSCSRFITNK